MEILITESVRLPWRYANFEQKSIFLRVTNYNFAVQVFGMETVIWNNE